MDGGKGFKPIAFRVPLSGHICTECNRNTVNPEIFARIIFFTNSFKRHSCGAKNLGLVHVLPISVINRVISPFCEDFIFAKLRIYAKFRENKSVAKISDFTV